MIDVRQFRDLVVRPTLESMGYYSDAALALLMGTAAQESRFTYLKQLGGGPALGLFQCEPATHADAWDSFLAYKPGLRACVETFCAPAPERVFQLSTNLSYATAICRVHYLRVAAPLPAADDVFGLAAYWKAHYNTPAGAGTVEEFVESFKLVEG